MLQRMQAQKEFEESKKAFENIMLEIAQTVASTFFPDSDLKRLAEALTLSIEDLKKTHQRLVQRIMTYRSHHSLTHFITPIYQLVHVNHGYFQLQRITVLGNSEIGQELKYAGYPLLQVNRLELSLLECVTELEDLVPALKFFPNQVDRQQLVQTMIDTDELAELKTRGHGEKITKAERMANLCALFETLGLFSEGKDKNSTIELAKAAMKIVDVSIDYAKDCIESYRSKDPSSHNKTSIWIYIKSAREWVMRLVGIEDRELRVES